MINLKSKGKVLVSGFFNVEIDFNEDVTLNDPFLTVFYN